MQIRNIRLKGFKCFKDETVSFDDLTTFIGANGAGKSSVLEALSKLFNVDSKQRNITSSDFYIPAGDRLEEQPERYLSIETILDFPEFDSDNKSISIPQYFNQMVVADEKEKPFCRIRLEAKWENTNSPGGDIEQRIFWITTSEEEFDDKYKKDFKTSDRSRIHMHYIPSLRDPLKQIKVTAGTLLYTFLQSVHWSDEIKTKFSKLSDEIKNAFGAETGVSNLQRCLSDAWQVFNSFEHYKEVSIRPLASDFDSILNKTEITFSPSPTGGESGLEKFSDGMKSLYYFTLIKSLLDIEEEIVNNPESGLDSSFHKPPYLTLIAIEEPENHLAPHYMGRIINTFRTIAEKHNSQVFITSHSPAIMKRIEPENVRFFRQDNNTLISKANMITLPDHKDEEFKYVKEAIKAYPELYFSKLVVFGEGDSEEVVIPKLFETFGKGLDETFISVVPLGGRHVNHFWRLCFDLGIPHVTLLDYDNYRGGGNWGRIKYVLKQLIANNVDQKELLELKCGKVLSLAELEGMHNWDINSSDQKSWVNLLEGYNVFFSEPYDLDYIMFKAFKDEYKKTAIEGPNIPNHKDENYEVKNKAAVASVRKNLPSEIDLTEIEDVDSYYWYRYLFLGKGKPVTHIKALSEVTPENLKKHCPKVLKEIVERINTILSDR